MNDDAKYIAFDSFDARSLLDAAWPLQPSKVKWLVWPHHSHWLYGEAKVSRYLDLRLPLKYILWQFEYRKYREILVLLNASFSIHSLLQSWELKSSSWSQYWCSDQLERTRIWWPYSLWRGFFCYIFSMLGAFFVYTLALCMLIFK